MWRLGAQFNASSEMAALIFENLILWHRDVWITTAIILAEDAMVLTLFQHICMVHVWGKLGITWTNDCLDYCIFLYWIQIFHL